MKWRSDSLARLAAVLSVLQGKEAPPETIDDELFHFAERRHRVGLLLLSVPDRLKPAHREALEKQHAAAKMRRAIQSMLMETIAKRFAERGVPWLVIKGAPLSQMLYPDPSLRPSSDIDILVPPEAFVAAIAELRGLNWSLAIETGPWTALAFRLLRDVDLFAPGGAPFHIELHQRPFNGEAFEETGADLFRTAQATPLPSPRLSPELAYFLLGHGALGYWTRLRWLMDVALLLPKLSLVDQDDVIAMARHRRTSHSLAACLLVIAAYFPSAVGGTLLSWANASRSHPGVKVRMQRYFAALEAADFRLASPITSRYRSLEAALLYHERPVQRAQIALSLPLAAAARHLAGLGHIGKPQA